ncbi:MAG: tetratricopeptide repeat protein [Spirochaetaceae bacterium]|nr:tetratricopeptide repeat protein [Spirochaetaceae bacterium]
MKYSRLVFLLSLQILLPTQVLQASPASDVSLNAVPSLSIAFGPIVDGDLPLFDMGGGASLRGDLRPGFARFLLGRVALDFDYLPFNGGAGGLSVLSGGGAIGLAYDPSARISLRAFAGGGIYMAFAEVGTIRNPYAEGGLEAFLRLGPTTGLGLGARLRQLFTPTGPLYQGVSIQLGIGYDLAGGRKGTEIRVEERLDRVFPLFYSYYDKNPAGTIRIENGESAALEKVRVSFYAKQYMDGPRLCADLGTLRGGESRDVPVYALFNDAIFKVTEGTKTAGEILVEYFYLGGERRVSKPVTVQVMNRNAMQWDDDRKAAAFVTAKDPLVLGFAKNVASTVRYEGAPPVSEDFRTAAGLFQTLKLYGLGYAIDPKTPFTELSADAAAVDFLQFPNQTLAYRAGDCDDLSTLYAALLEAVGIGAAFVTTPGHIFIAFDSGLGPDKAEKILSPEDFLTRDGRAWIPVEVTAVKDGFFRAWRLGAQEWNRAGASGQGGFFPIREAWKTYEPVGFVEGGIAVAIPSPERIVAEYRSEIRRVQEALAGPRVAAIQSADRAAGRGPQQSANRIGVLYAQLGMLDKAVEQFTAASKGGSYAPALANLGNALYLQGDPKAAYAQYMKALALSPDNPTALAGAARASYAMRDFTRSDELLARLRLANPELAARIDLASEAVPTARASEAVSVEVDAWDD